MFYGKIGNSLAKNPKNAFFVRSQWDRQAIPIPPLLATRKNEGKWGTKGKFFDCCPTSFGGALPNRVRDVCTRMFNMALQAATAKKKRT